MASITLQGNTIHTSGELPASGSTAPDFVLVTDELSEVSLSDYKGKRIIMNIFPSIDTGTCATSVRKFNEKASQLDNTVVLCISRDLPFAMSRFCAAEGLDNVKTLSDFREGAFGKSYQLLITDGPLQGLLSRVVILLDEEGNVQYTEQVSEIADEPDYDKVLAKLS